MVSCRAWSAPPARSTLFVAATAVASKLRNAEDSAAAALMPEPTHTRETDRTPGKAQLRRSGRDAVEAESHRGVVDSASRWQRVRVG
jgi:hypothetical protein